jgi:hypothetical protein
VRTGRIILSVLALLWGFLQAPFDHIHPEDLDHPPTSSLVHLHAHAKLTGGGPCISPQTADEDEIDVLWSVTTSAHLVLHPNTELTKGVSVPEPSLAAAAVAIPWLRGHDPPESSPKIPRAPPA